MATELDRIHGVLRLRDDLIPYDHLVQHVRLGLVLGGDVHEELLHVPVEHRAQVRVNLQREDGLVVAGAFYLPPARIDTSGVSDVGERVVRAMW